MSKISSLAHRFAGDAHGAIAIVFGLSFMAMILCAALAWDTSRVYNVKARVQAALDASALAGAKLLDQEGASDRDIKATARAFFNARKPQITMDGLILTHFNAVPDRATSSVTTSVRVRLKTYFGRLSGLDANMRFTPTASTTFKSKKIELTLVLDITGSMCSPCTKIDALKAAAKDLVDTLFASNPSAGAVKVALVPYSAAVNAGSYIGAVAQTPNGIDNCVVERTGAQAFTGVPPGAGAMLETSNTTENDHYSCPPSAIIPLTDLSNAASRNSLKASIDGLVTGGWTAGHIGAEWGWYMVEPQWNSVWPSSSHPRAYSDDVIKAVVLMTDGEFNTNYRNGTNNLACGTPGSWAAGSGCDQAVQICQNMRDAGVNLYTVGYTTPADAEAMLRQCSGTSNFYNADSSGQLMQAFKDIVDRLSNLRITS